MMPKVVLRPMLSSVLEEIYGAGLQIKGLQVSSVTQEVIILEVEIQPVGEQASKTFVALYI